MNEATFTAPFLTANGNSVIVTDFSIVVLKGRYEKFMNGYEPGTKRWKKRIKHLEAMVTFLSAEAFLRDEELTEF